MWQEGVRMRRVWEICYFLPSLPPPTPPALQTRRFSSIYMRVPSRATGGERTRGESPFDLGTHWEVCRAAAAAAAAVATPKRQRNFPSAPLVSHLTGLFRASFYTCSQARLFSLSLSLSLSLSVSLLSSPTAFLFSANNDDDDYSALTHRSTGERRRFKPFFDASLTRFRRK